MVWDQRKRLKQKSRSKDLVEFIHENEVLTFLPEKAIYWEDRSTLLIADLHFGKTNHFRKEGIAVPQELVSQDIQRLRKLLQNYPAENVYFLGDLFHSRLNKEWELLGEEIKTQSDTHFHLLVGNHDILNRDKYSDLKMVIHDHPLELGPFLLTHEPVEKAQNKLNLCGHIHPGVIIKGKGRQRVRLPCFYMTEAFLILPAFGTFTGLKTLSILKGTRVFAVLTDRVLEVGYQATI